METIVRGKRVHSAGSETRRPQEPWFDRLRARPHLAREVAQTLNRPDLEARVNEDQARELERMRQAHAGKVTREELEGQHVPPSETDATPDETDAAPSETETRSDETISPLKDPAGDLAELENAGDPEPSS